MTQDEIIEMAKQAGFEGCAELTWENVICTEELVAFAKLVAEHEREKYKWDIHSCSPTCNRYVCVAKREAVLAEREECAELVWPKLKVWSEEEQTAMGLAFNRAQEKHGWYETLMAVGASVLKIKAEAIRARGRA